MEGVVPEVGFAVLDEGAVGLIAERFATDWFECLQELVIGSLTRGILIRESLAGYGIGR